MTIWILFSFAGQIFGMGIILEILYLLSKLAASFGVRPILLYFPSFILGYLLIALAVVMSNADNHTFIEALVKMHTTWDFLVGYGPYLATPPLLLLLNRVLKVIDWNSPYAGRPQA